MVKAFAAVLVVLAMVGVSRPGHAATVCRRKSGVLVVRDEGCRKKEVALDAAALAALGLKGDKGDRGDPGPIAATLPSGTTFRGAFGFGVPNSGVAPASYAISFPFPLATSPTFHWIYGDSPVPAGCSGSRTSPGADPGHFCIFFGQAASTLQSHLGWAPPTGSPSDLRYGFEFLVFDGVTVDGTWAVTAP